MPPKDKSEEMPVEMETEGAGYPCDHCAILDCCDCPVIC